MLRDIFDREPAVLIGVLVSILLVVQSALTGEVAWQDAVPAIVGIVTRQFVYAPASVEDHDA